MKPIMMGVVLWRLGQLVLEYLRLVDDGAALIARESKGTASAIQRGP